MFLITFRIILPASCFKMLANPKKSSKADRDKIKGSFLIADYILIHGIYFSTY